MADFTASLSPNQLEVWNIARELATACNFEEVHSLQVTRLALRLYDDLQGLYKKGESERDWLALAGLLHDIGWIEGYRGHHKTSLNIILTTPMLPFNQRERLVIGSICRYHRRALPDMTHDNYAALESADRKTVDQLSAILRVADGLDSTHRSLVKDICARYDQKNVWIACQVSSPAADEQRDALKKGGLLEIVFKRKLSIEWKME